MPGIIALIVLFGLGALAWIMIMRRPKKDNGQAGVQKSEFQEKG